MKLISQEFEKDKSGRITLVAQDKDDLWTLYNLISKDDEITLRTQRNIKKKSTNSVGSATTVRKTIKLTLNVESNEFLPSDESMRIKGRTTEQNDDVPLGSYHTAEIQFDEKFTLHKDNWDEQYLKLVSDSCSIEAKAELGAVVLEEGVAHVCLITDSMTVLRAKVEKSIPRKRRGDSSGHDKAMDKFLSMCVDSCLRHLNVDHLKAILIVSPGFTAKLLLDKIMSRAVTDGNKLLLQSKSKFVVAGSSTGYLQGLEEALKTPELKKQLSDTKFQQHVALFDEFTKYLNDDEGKAWYGETEVEKAVVELKGAVKFT
ncbi:unnamed protein product [Ambrosiozyma monospora]|uniref:Unnamed protein product n=1 Tax=Ambrosiozyma monospora TaxID=43982 RepID=A0A9W6Z3Q7_AMBMO|nr:unnamed protein product [Ambrosiozyma monospora]